MAEKSNIEQKSETEKPEGGSQKVAKSETRFKPAEETPVESPAETPRADGAALTDGVQGRLRDAVHFLLKLVKDITTGRASAEVSTYLLYSLRMLALAIPVISVISPVFSLGWAGPGGWAADVVVNLAVGFLIYAGAEIILKIDLIYRNVVENGLTDAGSNQSS